MVKDTGVLPVLCEGSPFGTREAQELSLRELARVTVLSSTILEKSNQTLDALLGLCGADVFATSEWSEE